jgi:hypothetical protein
VAQKKYTHFDEKYYSIIVTPVFIQKQYMRDVLEFWIQSHLHPEIEISFKFISNILTSKECIHFFGPLCNIQILNQLDATNSPVYYLAFIYS